MTLKTNLVLGAYPKRPDRETLELVYDLFPRLREQPPAGGDLERR